MTMAAGMKFTITLDGPEQAMELPPDVREQVVAQAGRKADAMLQRIRIEREWLDALERDAKRWHDYAEDQFSVSLLSATERRVHHK